MTEAKCCLAGNQIITLRLPLPKSKIHGPIKHGSMSHQLHSFVSSTFAIKEQVGRGDEAGQAGGKAKQRETPVRC